MEYERTRDGQIQADFARRIGQVVIQYGQLSQQLPEDQRYEVTLWVCLLQALLTNCSETIKRNRSLNQSLKELSTVKLVEEPVRLGLDIECIEYFSGDLNLLTYAGFLECLRDALSHPNHQGGYERGASVTGYTTIKANSGKVEEFRFVWSPWVCEKERQLKDIYRPHSDSKKRETLERECRKLKKKLGIGDLEIHEAKGGCLEVMRSGRPFRPELRVRLTTTQLRTLTLELSQYLSEPLEKVAQANQEYGRQRIAT